MVINVQLLGSPKVTAGGRHLVFPYRKAEGLFYYLCVNQVISRDEAVGIFWADCEESCARKNLRDALYNLKKILGNDIMAAEGNNRIRLVREKIGAIDFEELTAGNLFERYTGEFLGYFYVKNCVEFETWTTEIREELQRQFHRAAVERVAAAAGQKKLQPIVQLGNALLRKHFYDEALYRELIHGMMGCGGYQAAEVLYGKLEALLKEDLEIEPEQETRDLCREAEQMKQEYRPAKRAKTKPAGFFGRHREIMYLLNDIQCFSRGDQAFSVLLTGEPGVGKSAILNRIRELLSPDNYISIYYQCVQTEADLYLKPWNDIIKQTELLCRASGGESPAAPGVFHQQIPKTVYAAQFESFCQSMLDRMIGSLGRKKLILFLDDVQWMDESSLRVLSNVIFWAKNRKLIVLMAGRNERSARLDGFKANLMEKDMLRELEIRRFTVDETEQFVTDCGAEGLSSKKTILDLYCRTGGNALFLTEFIKEFEHGGDIGRLPPKTANMIQSRLIGLTDQDRHILEYIALYPRFATLEELQVLASQTKLEILRSLEKLMDRGLICQNSTYNKTGYSFSHQLIRDYIYEHMLEDIRLTLHTMAAEAQEALYLSGADLNCCPILIYHFTRCGNLLKSYTYQLEYLKGFYNVAHEIYPALHPRMEHMGQVPQLTGQDALVKLTEQIRQLHRQDPEAAVLKMNADFLLGRFDLFSGNYDRGLKNIEASIQMAKVLGNDEALMENYLQIVYHSIQIYDLAMFEQYIADCESLMSRASFSEDKVSTVIRLQGLLYMKNKEYARARETFRKVIQRLEPFYRIDVSYCIGLAACYNYLGESFQENGELEKALSYYLHALSYCENQPVTCGTGIFYANAGNALCELDRLDEAQVYMDKAIECLNMHGAIWGRARTEAYAALLAIKCGELQRAEEYLKSARQVATLGENPRILQLVWDMEAVLKESLDS